MFSLFNTPTWFNGWDLAFDAVSLIIAFLIAAYSWRVYKFTKENQFAYFSFAFILICLAFLFRIMAQGLIYSTPARNVAMSILIPVVGRGAGGVNYSDLFFRGGFFAYMITMLGAWLLLFFISQKRSGRLKKYYEVSQIALFVYLIVLISFVSNFKYFVFYLTSLVILGMTTLNYYKNYLNTERNRSAFLVMLAFLFLLLGNMFFIFVFIYANFYVFGEILILIGFLLLLHVYSNVKRKYTKVN